MSFSCICHLVDVAAFCRDPSVVAESSRSQAVFARTSTVLPSMDPRAAPTSHWAVMDQRHAAWADNVTSDPCSCLGLVGCQARPPNGLPQDVFSPLEHLQIVGIFLNQNTVKVPKPAIEQSYRLPPSKRYAKWKPVLQLYLVISL